MPNVNLCIADGDLPLSQSDQEELKERVSARKFDLLKKVLNSK